MTHPVGAFGQQQIPAAWDENSAEAKRFLVGVHLTPKLLTALERYRASLDDEVSRPRAIRLILLDWLKANGQL